MSNNESLANCNKLKSAMVQSSNASSHLFSAATSEANLIEAWLEDFADSELDMRNVHRLMMNGLPAVGNAQNNEKSPDLIISPEGLIAMTKATELFILDLALKTFQSKALEPDEKKRISTQLNLEDLCMAVRNEEYMDIVDTVTARPSPPEKRALPTPLTSKSKPSSDRKSRRRLH